MKTKLLSLISLLCLLTTAYTQNITIVAPPYDALVGPAWAPNGAVGHTNYRAHFIVPASELIAMPSGTSIDQVGLSIYIPPTWAGTGTPAGNLQIYLENTPDATNMKSEDWSVAVSSMTSVYNASYSVPTVTAPIDLSVTTPFVYTGGGLYVAYDYVGTAFTTQPISAFVNDELSNSCWYGSSNNSATPVDSLTTLSSVRPEFRFTYVNAFTNNLSASRISPTYGTSNSLIISDNTVDVEISNIGTQAQSNIPVTLELVGNTTYSATQTISSIGAGASQVLTFASVPSDGGGNSQTIKVHFPADQQTFNDTLEYVQDLACDQLNYANSGPLTSIIGLPTAATAPRVYGIRYDLNNTLPVNVTNIDFNISNSVAATGNTVKGLLLNSAGVKVDSTAPYTITAADIGQVVSLPFINGNTNYANQTVFAGVRLSTPGVNTLCIQDQLTPPQDRNFTSGPNGGVITYQNGFAPMMIAIGIEPRSVFLLPSNNVSTVCAGANVPLFTSSVSYDNYTLFGNNVQLATNTTGLFNVNPTVTTTYEVELEKNGCTFPSLTSTITVVSQFTTSQTESICAGETFTFNGQNITTAGQYSETFTAVGGCDSIVTLDLSVLQPSNAIINESICNGDSYSFGGQTLTIAGTYTDVLVNAAGCDSNIALNLNVLLDDISISQVGATLTAEGGGVNATYQWIDCEDNSFVLNAESQSFTPTDDMGVVGNYAVIVTEGNCSETSACATVDFTSVESNGKANIRVFPNPAVNELFVKTDFKSFYQYRIIDVTGKLIQTAPITASEVIEINVSALAKGTYVLELVGNNNNSINTTFVK